MQARAAGSSRLRPPRPPVPGRPTRATRPPPPPYPPCRLRLLKLLIILSTDWPPPMASRPQLLFAWSQTSVLIVLKLWESQIPNKLEFHCKVFFVKSIDRGLLVIFKL